MMVVEEHREDRLAGEASTTGVHRPGAHGGSSIGRSCRDRPRTDRRSSTIRPPCRPSTHCPGCRTMLCSSFCVAYGFRPTLRAPVLRDAGKDTGMGCLDPPGTPARFRRLPLLAFIIRTTSQTADITITSGPVRRLALLHRVIAFFFDAPCGADSDCRSELVRHHPRPVSGAVSAARKASTRTPRPISPWDRSQESLPGLRQLRRYKIPATLTKDKALSSWPLKLEVDVGVAPPRRHARC